MTSSLPKGVQHVTKRRADGTIAHHYYWRRGRVKLPNPDDPGFAAAIARARILPAESATRGSFKALLLDYKRSPNFRALRPPTQKAYDRAIARLRAWEPIAVADIKRRSILEIRDALALRTPQAANYLVMVLSTLMKFAVERDYRESNPCAGISRLKGGEHRRWPEPAIAYALAHLAEGYRRAIVLALYTGQREADCLAMRWDDYDGTGVAVVQQKTGARLWIPAHRALKREIDAWRTEAAAAATILVGPKGRPWKRGSFGTMFCETIADHPPLHGLVFHGLRKAAAARLAEAGCSTLEIGAITGHKTLGMIELYTREADQKQRARSAIRKLEIIPPGAQ
jgi:integrase